ncbi:MAG: hypothetical protein M3Q76_13595 [Acidobacteriota bacterium]|nr:hypothetical protein [Acidobacteriota bacterium]
MRSHAVRSGLTFPALWLAALACALCLGHEARGQEPLVPPQPAPPPMRYIPDAERAQLSAARDSKARTRLSLELGEQRLTNAEGLTARQQFDAATAELGIYQQLIGDAIKFLIRSGKDDGKTRDQYKRIELSLFKHAARIESMRRSTPPDYANNVRAAIKFTQEARSTALEAFYGQTVLRDRPAMDTSPEQNQSKDKPAGTPPPSPEQN